MTEQDHSADSSANTQTRTIQFDWQSDRTVSSTVVSLVADLEDANALDLEPLHNTVDPDALDQLFVPTANGAARTVGHVSFVFEGYHVTVYGDGEISVSEPVRVQ